MKKTIIFKKNIVLGVGGGIAAYKSVYLLRELVGLGANVKVIMTTNAANFVTPKTFEVLSSNRVILNLFEDANIKGVPHIDLADFADIVILAPATANMIAKIANGISDDAISTFMLAVTCPVILCPSMNSNMYQHPVTQRNLNQVKADGNFVLSTDYGALACGVNGSGRLLEPLDIIDRVISYLTHNDMASIRVLITAGPTREFIDPVRFISNPSSGKMGYAIARAAENRGAKVIIISGPVNVKKPIGLDVVYVNSADEMSDEVFRYLDEVDIVIKVAAVSDYKSEHIVSKKIKKNQSKINLNFVKNDDILSKISRVKKAQIVVGFAAETNNLVINAKKKLKNKKLDMIVANLVGHSDNCGFLSDDNSVSIFFPNGKEEKLDLMSKDELAHILLDRVLEIFKFKQNNV